LRTHLDALEGLLEGDSWLVGASPSIADFAIAAQLDELRRTSRHAHELDARPRQKAWLQRCQPELT
jgi:glutathione S-transferase